MVYRAKDLEFMGAKGFGGPRDLGFMGVKGLG